MQHGMRIAAALLAASVATAEPGVTNTIVPVSVEGGARLDAVQPQQLPMADRAVLHKAERRLYLYKDGAVLRSYRAALGLQPDGTKQRSGDFRTPEGVYRLTRRNTHSDYFLSIQVSYPNAEDLQRARRNGWEVGGSIMVHGLPNVLHHAPEYYAHADWTDGCIALSNSDMVEFWLLTPDNMTIEITP
jgi:murein L,D-transpeptidase YafK